MSIHSFEYVLRILKTFPDLTEALFKESPSISQAFFEKLLTSRFTRGKDIETIGRLITQNPSANVRKIIEAASIRVKKPEAIQHWQWRKV